MPPSSCFVEEPTLTDLCTPSSLSDSKAAPCPYLTIYTHNTACIPLDLTYPSNVKSLQSFQSSIPSSKYDIISLQEVFETITPPDPVLVERHWHDGVAGRMKILWGTIKTNGISVTKHKRSRVPGWWTFGTTFRKKFLTETDAGLVTYSRYEMMRGYRHLDVGIDGTQLAAIKPKYHMFKHQTDAMRRGFLVSIISVPQHPLPILHINTHLSPSYHPLAAAIRLSQITELIHVVLSDYSALKDRIVLTGDLNACWWKSEERWMVECLMKGLDVGGFSEGKEVGRDSVGSEGELSDGTLADNESQDSPNSCNVNATTTDHPPTPSVMHAHASSNNKTSATTSITSAGKTSETDSSSCETTTGAKTPSSPTPPSHTFIGSESEPPATFDYVLISNKLGFIVDLTTVRDGKEFGDHLPLVASVMLYQ
ncbi:hypothetical protein HK097_007903 [Rhizophlyctis rosea]|uniref:Endonuclease/exonuclease/phosphatase domain-containing protein n=1 Tax=Rhizophlyctis rosea TaxID=64517 RepID=A0AAD5X4X4_9FUNG|nr:hypothetical protein HK097_007903 [Rhizophlyctis rosea]